MKTISPLSTVAVPLSVALLLVSPPKALAQTFYSFAGGLNVARTVPTAYDAFHGYTTHGFALQASVGHRVTRRLGWRLDAFASQFDFSQPSDFAGVMCVVNPPPGTCCGICPVGTSKGLVGVTGLAASELVSVMPSASPSGVYVIAGAEMDYLYRHPSAQGALRLGGSAGVGAALSTGGRFYPFVEARYHTLIGAPNPKWFVPVTFGIRF